MQTTPTPSAEEKSADFLYKQTIEIRNFEIAQLANRNNFFMIFQGVLMAGLMQASATIPPVVSFLACLCGLLISILQTGMASGAKFWQEAWEEDVKDSEIRLKGLIQQRKPPQVFYALFSRLPTTTKLIVKERLKQNGHTFNLLVRRWSVSRIPIWAGIVFSVFWLCLILSTLNGPLRDLMISLIIGFPKAA